MKPRELRVLSVRHGQLEDIGRVVGIGFTDEQWRAYWRERDRSGVDRTLDTGELAPFSNR